jgi:hypothetical protein
MSGISLLSLRQANRYNGPCGREKARERGFLWILQGTIDKLTRLRLTSEKMKSSSGHPTTFFMQANEVKSIGFGGFAGVEIGEGGNFLNAPSDT